VVIDNKKFPHQMESWPGIHNKVQNWQPYKRSQPREGKDVNRGASAPGFLKIGKHLLKSSKKIEIIFFMYI
jgi:hypothetical protein